MISEYCCYTPLSCSRCKARINIALDPVMRRSMPGCDLSLKLILPPASRHCCGQALCLVYCHLHQAIPLYKGYLGACTVSSSGLGRPRSLASSASPHPLCSLVNLLLWLLHLMLASLFCQVVGGWAIVLIFCLTLHPPNFMDFILPKVHLDLDLGDFHFMNWRRSTDPQPWEISLLERIPRADSHRIKVEPGMYVGI